MTDLQSNLLGILVSYIFIFFIIVTSKVVSKYGPEVSRKYIHIILANWWIIAMIFFKGVLWAAFVPATFVIINYISYKKDLIKVMERNEKDKDGLGTVYYALSLLILAVITFAKNCNPLIGLFGVFVMGYGDGLAAVIGKKVKSRKYKVGNKEKSVAGSLTMFVVTFICTLIILMYLKTGMIGIKAIGLAVILTILEGISIKGTDNITVPLSASLLLGLMI